MPSVITSATSTAPGFSALLAAVRDVYSAEIYFTALPILRFDQFAVRKEELGVQPGGQIIMPKFGNIKRGGTLIEGSSLVTHAMSQSQLAISVAEQGNAVGVTERLLQTSFYDQLAAATMVLGRDMAIVLDSQLRDTVKGGTNKIYANNKPTRNSLVAGDGFGPPEIHRATELLETNNVPKWGGDFYICFVHPHQVSSLRQSAGWINANQYAGATPIFYGEIGRYNDVRFISTSMMPNGLNASLDDTGQYADPAYDPALDQTVTGALGASEIYQAYMFGEFAYGHAVALPVELRDNGVQDFGRKHGLAWYAIWGNGLLEALHSVIIETA